MGEDAPNGPPHDWAQGGVANLGQVYEFDPDGQTTKLIYQSASGKTLENPHNVVYVPKTGDISLQEDSDPEHIVSGLPPNGEIYDFARTITNNTEFCAGCFSPGGAAFSPNQRGAAVPRRVLQTRTP